MDLISVPALQDNYIWLLADTQAHCVIIDPGEAAPVFTALTEQQLTADAILLTHHHYDHLDGVVELLRRFPGLPVYGPQETADKGATVLVKEGDDLTIGSQNFSIIAVPGHTLGHIAYYNAPYLFCGDTLFSAGCGRLFEGTCDQMYASIQKIMQLPDDTLICSAHEYTLSNLAFARSILPQDRKIETYQQHIEQLRAKNQPSLPTTLQLEREINVFLRCSDIELQKKVGITPYSTSFSSIFSALRVMKDRF
ncbi:hydroxyacylglutathione hydrolase [Candidatus Fukatsuia symbiotica]|uniref:Hydroxyacylglutathione hydrolase n=1 Tax=Candidatus Fukatsuia symbiotica TaxID=1878942 RepID=A0A2Y9CKA5_9GAMM|nr:hydroxyacylglutathione hydrolase [Candidatus Fukatsuia symbiotica]AWK13270.1 hydroxyacylglutathione hydrolase [Candidatus Fukatsuia symbiotica]MEA9444140.1 hydroxyacylglutathione hydrolase [Candidatus Fukatsuia symbiotica]